MTGRYTVRENSPTRLTLPQPVEDRVPLSRPTGLADPIISPQDLIVVRRLAHQNKTNLIKILDISLSDQQLQEIRIFQIALI